MAPAVMSGHRITALVNLTVHVEYCYECGTPIGIERSAWANIKATGGTFCCWRGHRCTTGEGTRNKELREANERAERLERFNRAERERAERAERSLRAQRAATTRLRNRIARGVCPCCKRTFADLAKHMATKHPDFGDG